VRGGAGNDVGAATICNIHKPIFKAFGSVRRVQTFDPLQLHPKWRDMRGHAHPYGQPVFHRLPHLVYLLSKSVQVYVQTSMLTRHSLRTQTGAVERVRDVVPEK
jgi:hypothetical protein